MRLPDPPPTWVRFAWVLAAAGIVYLLAVVVPRVFR